MIAPYKSESKRILHMQQLKGYPKLTGVLIHPGI
jgi:hypothetical protein